LIGFQEATAISADQKAFSQSAATRHSYPLNTVKAESTLSTASIRIAFNFFRTISIAKGVQNGKIVSTKKQNDADRKFRRRLNPPALNRSFLESDRTLDAAGFRPSFQEKFKAGEIPGDIPRGLQHFFFLRTPQFP
jgi:hypothetical protein